MNAQLPTGHSAVPSRKTGILLLNLGTPDATDYWSVRRYLEEFLSDPRVIETPRLIWWPLLNGVILSVRPQKAGANYAKIWDREENDSPLRVITRRQAEKLQAAFAGRDDVLVDYGMRYGNPSIKSAIERLHEAGCDRILLFPLYPQYSATTTGTANDQAFRALMKIRWQPAVRTVPAYFEDPGYVEVLARSITEGLAKLDFTPDLVITSYHGMPRSYIERGDPYYDQCHETTRLVGEHLGWEQDRLMVTFQSRFGPTEWLQPYTDETLESLPGKGIKKVAILAPAFSVDCIETLEEIEMEGRDLFMAAGGENYAYIPCLNDTPDGMKIIETIARRELSGWL
ncbi:ferrochelatase [Pelagibacterium sediminicola]|uniref:ferrochelatase n=1 Tax=Pelagibacterium sediminicola TaxID=2248761 RepID=UPI000E31D6A1|nr:ferrochelatase [Pelagibacterium sediminicola]